MGFSGGHGAAALVHRRDRLKAFARVRAGRYHRDVTERLDLKGLKCPLPVLRTKKALKAMPPGTEVEVLATNSGAVKDFQAFCDTTGDTLLDWHEDGGVYTFRLRKKAA